MVGAASRGRPAVYHFKERTTRPLVPLLRSIPHTSDYFPSTGLFNDEKDPAEYVPLLARKAVFDVPFC
jgi:hypothetical protein